MRFKRKQTIWQAALILAACVPASHAQEGNCTASARIAMLGAPMDVDNRRSMMQSVAHGRYRVYATSEEKQCVSLSFDIIGRYTDKDGKPVSNAIPGMFKFAGGESAEAGELIGRRQDSKRSGSLENVVCRRC